jgi:hypothetical protein
MDELGRWAKYVDRVIGDTGQAEAAKMAGVDQSCISRWRSGKLQRAPDARAVVAFARAFGRPAVEALAAAGYITAAEARAVETDNVAALMRQLLDVLEQHDDQKL